MSKFEPQLCGRCRKRLLALRGRVWVSICTFVPVKQVKWELCRCCRKRFLAPRVTRGRMCQYLNFCTSKASKADKLTRGRICVSTCTFVPVKQVKLINWVPESQTSGFLWVPRDTPTRASVLSGHCVLRQKPQISVSNLSVSKCL